MEEKALVGRPKKYNNATEMKEAIDKYFASCFTYETNKEGNLLINPITGEYILKQIRPFTISGLANAIGLSRQGLLNYSKEEEFYDIILEAKRKCEVYAEERLFDKDGVKGAIFSLTNNYDNWQNKQELGGKFGIGNIEEYLKEVEDKNEY